MFLVCFTFSTACSYIFWHSYERVLTLLSFFNFTFHLIYLCGWNGWFDFMNISTCFGSLAILKGNRFHGSVFWHHIIKNPFFTPLRSLTRKTRMALQPYFIFRKYIQVSFEFIFFYIINVTVPSDIKHFTLFIMHYKMNGTIIWSESMIPNMVLPIKTSLKWNVSGYLTGVRHLLGQVR